MHQSGWWPRGLAAAALLAWTGNAGGQSVDTSMARAEVDQPLAMSVQVRGFDWPASRMTPECLQVHIQQGESGETVTPLRLRTIPSGDDGRVVVQISSPQRVTDTVVTGRLRLLCGADYTREFTVLADPPRPNAAPARPITTKTPVQQPRPAPEAPRTAPPRPALDDAAVQHLVAAVVSALHQTPASNQTNPLPAQPPAASLPAERPDSGPAWLALQEEQRQTRTAVAALLARIERAEHHDNPWRDASLVAGGILGLLAGLLLLRLVREGVMPRFGSAATTASTAFHLRRQRARWQAEEEHLVSPHVHDPHPSPAASHLDPGMFTWAPPGPMEPVHPTTTHSEMGKAIDTTSPSRWPDADFGQPSLDMLTASTELLQELAPLVTESPVGVALVLERRLQASADKCPWILLRLLELYRQMAQPWNHERVAAQLEALYNIRVRPMASEQPHGDTGLETCSEALDSVMQAWSQDDPAPALAGLMLHPATMEAHEQSVFEDILLLHSIARNRQPLWLAAVDCSAESPWSSPTAQAAPSSSNRLMELLAA